MVVVAVYHITPYGVLRPASATCMFHVENGYFLVYAMRVPVHYNLGVLLPNATTSMCRTCCTYLVPTFQRSTRYALLYIDQALWLALCIVVNYGLNSKFIIFNCWGCCVSGRVVFCSDGSISREKLF